MSTSKVAAAEAEVRRCEAKAAAAEANNIAAASEVDKAFNLWFSARATAKFARYIAKKDNSATEEAVNKAIYRAIAEEERASAAFLAASADEKAAAAALDQAIADEKAAAKKSTVNDNK
jgi:hypothetical protein